MTQGPVCSKGGTDETDWSSLFQILLRVQVIRNVTARSPFRIFPAARESDRPHICGLQHPLCQNAFAGGQKFRCSWNLTRNALTDPVQHTG